jgi:hypothetical protein
MASTKQQTNGSITLNGSSELVKEYLGMYNKFKTLSYVSNWLLDLNLIPIEELNLYNAPVLICNFFYLRLWN